MFNYYVKKVSNLSEKSWFNGYIEIPLGNWLYGLDYDVVTDILKNNNSQLEFNLTFATKKTDLGGNFWILGFDTRDYKESKKEVEILTEKLSKVLFNLKPVCLNS